MIRFIALAWLGLINCVFILSIAALAEDPPAADKPSTGAQQAVTQHTPEEQAQLDKALDLSKQAGQLYGQGKFAEAEKLAQQVLEINERVLGPDDPAVAKCLSNLALLYFRQGGYAQAETLYQRALKINQKAFGPEHAAVAESLNNLAGLYAGQGKYAQAEPFYQQALAICEKNLGPNDPDVAGCLFTLGKLYRTEHKYTEAEAVYQRVLKIVEQHYGPDHPGMANCLFELAELYVDQHLFAQAEPLMLRAIGIDEKAYGPDDPHVAADLNNAGTMYDEQAQYAKSLPLYERALRIREKTYGPDHPQVAMSLRSLAGAYQAQGNYADALPLFKRALAIDEKVLGPNDPQTWVSLNNLADFYREQGSYSDALPLFQRALKICEQIYGLDAKETAASVHNLALLYSAQANSAEALPLFQRAVKIMENAAGSDDPNTAVLIAGLAAEYRLEGNYAAAVPLYERALNIDEKAYGPEHPQVAVVLNGLALTYESQGDFGEALSSYQRALDIDEKRLGPDHPDTARVLNNIAEVYSQQGNYEEAIAMSQRALKIRQQALGPENLTTLTTVNNLARYDEQSGDFADAVPLHERVLATFEKTLGPNHPSTALALNNLAFAYSATGKQEQALSLYQRASEIINRNLDQTAAVQSENQQFANVQQSRMYLDSFVSCALLAGGDPTAVCQQMLAWKGAITLRQQIAHAARSDDGATEKPLWDELTDVSNRLARLGRATPPADKQAAWHKQLDDLTERKESLEAELSKQSAAFQKLHDQRQLTVEQLAEQLPPDMVVVDLLQFQRNIAEKKADGSTVRRTEERLMASVMRHDRQAVLVDLGLMDPISDAVRKWRVTYGAVANSAEESPGQTLRRLLWEPLSAHLDGVHVVLISPDGDTASFPWEALPGNKPDTFLIEDIGIAIIPVPQMLPSLLEENRTAAQHSNSSLLLLGDVDYGASPGHPEPQAAGNLLLAADAPQAAIRGMGKTEFSPLPGTSTEIDLIGQIYRERFAAGQMLDLKRGDATQQRFREAAPQCQYLHLATHGFFSPATNSGVGVILRLDGKQIAIARLIAGGAAAQDGRLKPDDRILAVAADGKAWTLLEGKSVPETERMMRGPVGTKISLRVQPAAGGDVAEYELTRKPFAQQSFLSQAATSTGGNGNAANIPGLLSGIVLAGANAPPKPDQDDGILTALEVSSLDLHGVDLAVLSACETGLGQTAGGEGTLGLQRAFQVAGAKTTISSLWSVDDAATQTLMVEFYKRLWDKDHPLGKLEALRQAQLEMLRHYDPHAAKLVGQNRGLEIDAPASESGGRLSPKYWAPFVLSGDWR
ncbi:MAG TPA: tetratricopeptide repeat protein [Pirellulales bacterium]|nr:tetratricopeptide repeat protein [Pirellulales bacterium]